MFSEFSMHNIEGIHEVDETKRPKQSQSLLLDMINNGYLPSNAEMEKLGKKSLFEINQGLLKGRSAI